MHASRPLLFVIVFAIFLGPITGQEDATLELRIIPQPVVFIAWGNFVGNRKWENHRSSQEPKIEPRK